MKVIGRPFTKIINGSTQFVIPVFQRDYRWSEAQCEQLWRDILHIAQDETARGHFSSGAASLHVLITAEAPKSVTAKPRQRQSENRTGLRARRCRRYIAFGRLEADELVGEANGQTSQDELLE